MIERGNKAVQDKIQFQHLVTALRNILREDSTLILTDSATLYAGGGQLADAASYGIRADGTQGLLAHVAEIFKQDTLAQTAFGNAFGEVFGQTAGTVIGNVFVAVCLFFFAFSTIISWNLFGKINFEYLFKKKAVIVFSIVAILFILVGAVLKVSLVWELMDFFNYLMVLPNAIALFALSSTVAKCANRKKKDRLEDAGDTI